MIIFGESVFRTLKIKKMNDLNLRFERTPSSRHMTYLKEQKQRRDADEGIMFAEGECMDNYYATRLSDWMNKKPGTALFYGFKVDLGDLPLGTLPSNWIEPGGLNRI